MTSFEIIKNQKNIETTTIGEALGSIQKKFSSDHIEISLLKMTEDRLLYIDVQNDERSYKCYFILSGMCEILNDRSVLSSGDIVVCNQLKEVKTLHALEQTEILIFNVRYSSYDTIKKSNIKLDKLMNDIQLKDQYTKVHCENVQKLAKKMAMKLGYVSEGLYAINKAAAYHDIGKIDIDDLILNKPDKLNEMEYGHIKGHVENARRFIVDNYNEYIYDIISQHHERIDGTGYPKGLFDAEIMEEAKIIAICDSYDAMTSNRVYQQGKSHLEAIGELIKLAGIKYDKRLVDTFIEIFQE